MMNCLCCGKPLKAPIPASGWHELCIRRFFGTKALPELVIDEASLALLAEKTARRGYTVPGVQKKLSLHLSRDKLSRLTIVDYPTGYILKPQVEEFEAMPESEHLVMQMASAAGISVAPHALMKQDKGYAYITRRMDRVTDEDGNIKMLAMEDFCQLDRRLTADKYRGSYERCTKVIQRYSSRTGLDIAELFLRLVFCFLTGNSDMHLKNFSLIETDEGSATYILSPAYDLLPVNVLMPEDTEETALTLNGKKTNLRKKDFLEFAENCGISGKVAETLLLRMVSHVPGWRDLCEVSLVPEWMKKALIDLMEQRAERLLWNA